MSLDPVSTFDCLFLGARLGRRMRTFTGPDIHLFAYLGCLLSVYRADPVSEWGYDFISNDLGGPFSVSVDHSLKTLTERGLLEIKEDGMCLTPSASSELVFFESLQFYKDRSEFLTAAAASVLVFPVGIVREALSQEPELFRARSLTSTRHLLEAPGIELLHEQFAELSDAIGTSANDLRLPSVTWLTALFREAQAATP